MRVLLTTYGSRGDVEPTVGPAVQLGALGAEARVCVPPDQEFAELPAGAGVPLVPIGEPVRPPVTEGTPPSPADLLPRTAELVAARLDTVASAAEACDAPLANGALPTGGWR